MSLPRAASRSASAAAHSTRSPPVCPNSVLADLKSSRSTSSRPTWSVARAPGWPRSHGGLERAPVGHPGQRVRQRQGVGALAHLYLERLRGDDQRAQHEVGRHDHQQLADEARGGGAGVVDQRQAVHDRAADDVEGGLARRVEVRGVEDDEQQVEARRRGGAAGGGHRRRPRSAGPWRTTGARRSAGPWTTGPPSARRPPRQATHTTPPAARPRRSPRCRGPRTATARSRSPSGTGRPPASRPAGAPPRCAGLESRSRPQSIHRPGGRRA